MAKREKKRHHDWHHRKPRSLGGGSDSRNMSHVSVSKHRAFHILFSNMTPKEIAEVLNRVWIDPDWKFTAYCTVIEDE